MVSSPSPEPPPSAARSSWRRYISEGSADANSRTKPRKASPLAPLATVSLYAQTDSQYFANSEASALALIEALSSAVAHSAKDSLKAATGLAEAVLPWLHGAPVGRLRSAAKAGAAKPLALRKTSRTTKVRP